MHARACALHPLGTGKRGMHGLNRSLTQITEWLILRVNYCLFPSPNICLFMNSFKILNDVPPWAWPREKHDSDYKRKWSTSLPAQQKVVQGDYVTPYFVAAAIYRRKQTNKSHPPNVVSSISPVWPWNTLSLHLPWFKSFRKRVPANVIWRLQKRLNFDENCKSTEH